MRRCENGKVGIKDVGVYSFFSGVYYTMKCVVDRIRLHIAGSCFTIILVAVEFLVKGIRPRK